MIFSEFITTLLLWSGLPYATDPGALELYSIASSVHPNPAGDVNETMQWGWNIAPGGGPKAAGEPAWFLSFESNYQPDPIGNPDRRLLEWHLQYNDGQGNHRRPISAVVDKDTHEAEVGFFAEQFTLAPNGTSPAFVRVVPTGGGPLGNGYAFDLGTRVRPMSLRIGANNAKAIQQTRAQGGSATLIMLDTFDRVLVGANATGGIYFAHPSKPTVSNCAQLGQAMHNYGLINWQPTP